MHGCIKILSGFLFAGFTHAGIAQQQAGPLEVDSHRDTVNRYCVACHNDAANTAGLSLQNKDPGMIGEGAEVWEKVLRKLRARAMPPAGMPRPDEETYDEFADYLENELSLYARQHPEPGKPMVRRMNRTEYMNSVRDLFAVEINGDELLPADDTMFGFDNVGTVLTLSPLLVEQYISAAHKIRLQILGDQNMQPEIYFYRTPRYLLQEERLNEDLPFGSRGGIAIHHHFPVDGEYILKIQLQRNSRDYIRGLVNKPHQLDVRLDGELVKIFQVGGEKLGKSAGIFSSGAQGEVEQERYERNADDPLYIRLPVKAGSRLISVAFLKETTKPEEPHYSPMSIIDYDQYKGGVPGVGTVSVEGPFNGSVSVDTASREKLFVCQPADDKEMQCARTILANLARRAYRRTPSNEEISELMEFFRYGQEESFDEGIGMAIDRMLASPEFLFIIEEPPANLKDQGIFKISDLELATKLSLFLWSSIPDDELLSVAESGELHHPDVLKYQVQRMLDDAKSSALVDNFASQWLTLRKLNVLAPDGEIFPYFDDNLRLAFKQETEMLFAYILREDRSLLELLDAEYTFVNDRLAEHYGIKNIYGSHFRKVSLEDKTRGGILGQGSLLAVTSYPNRTSPVIRGKWILENILGAPPPPPPANVPGLRAKNDEGKVMSMREQMEQHRANPVCASCHKVMDPLGFALERYDAIGSWRSVDGASGTPIDASGSLPDGTAFNGPVELREVLLRNRRQDFILTAVDKLLTYALGREISHTDAPAIRSIMKQAARENYKLSATIQSIAGSTPFLMRKASDHDDGR